MHREKVFCDLHILDLKDLHEDLSIYVYRKKFHDDINVDDIFNLLFINCKRTNLYINCDNLNCYCFDENQKLYYIFENKYLSDKDLGIPYENVIDIKPISIEYCVEYDDTEEDLSSDVLGVPNVATVELFSNFISCHLLVKYHELDFFIKNKVEVLYLENNIPIWIKYLIISFKAYKSSQYQLAFSLGYIAFDSFITLVNKEYNSGNGNKPKYYKYHQKMEAIDKLLNVDCWCKIFSDYRDIRNDLLHGNEINFDDRYYEKFIFDFYLLMCAIYNL